MMRGHLRVIGDRWALLILYAACEGSQNFEEFCATLGIARNVLTNRLRRLVDAGIFLRIAACHDARRVEYRLTPLGEALRPMLQALDLWGEDWQRSRPPVVSEPAARTATPRQPA